MFARTQNLKYVCAQYCIYVCIYYVRTSSMHSMYSMCNMYIMCNICVCTHVRKYVCIYTYTYVCAYVRCTTISLSNIQNINKYCYVWRIMYVHAACLYVYTYVCIVCICTYVLLNIPDVPKKWQILWCVDLHGHFEKGHVDKKGKLPAASLFSRKQGLGLPMHIRCNEKNTIYPVGVINTTFLDCLLIAYWRLQSGKDKGCWSMSSFRKPGSWWHLQWWWPG